MIAVIADDLTGAAEIAGIALRNGFRVVMETKVHADVDTDVLVIATDSRSKTSKEAKSLIGKITRELVALKPELIFKKADSLLRGHIGDELDAQLAASGKKRTVLIPANPSLKRTIKDGVYYADNVPLVESQLADAYRKKISTSLVADLVGEKFKAAISVISVDEDFTGNKLIIGNAVSETDLEAWAKRIDADTIPAGSSGFFNAILKGRKAAEQQKIQKEFCVGKRMLYVCGSAFLVSKAHVKMALMNGKAVCYMPANIFCGENLKLEMNNWVNEITDAMKNNGIVIMAVDRLLCKDRSETPVQIRTVMAAVIKKIMQSVTVDELLIEGGATASAIIEELDYTRFFPTNELAQGVIRMKVQEDLLKREANCLNSSGKI